MIANGMSVFWITINPADLQCPLVTCVTGIELEFSSKIQSIFWCKTVTINPFAIAKFVHIICNAIFMSLFSASQTKKELLGPILNYFGTIKTNSREMLHLYCLVLLKDILHLPTLQTQIQSNDKFCQKLLSFLERIIKCSGSQNLHLQTLDQACSNANNAIITLQFANLLRSNSEAIT